MKVVSRRIKAVIFEPETDHLRLTVENVYDLDGTPKTVLDTQAAGRLSEEVLATTLKSLRDVLQTLTLALDAGYDSQATDVAVALPSAPLKR